MRGRPLYDVVALLVRIGVGGVFIAHGWRKIQVGVTATARDFDALGVPAPTPAAIYATFVELLGGVALIVGIALPVAGLLLFLEMAAAFAFVHAENGLFVIDGGGARNGYELVLVLGLTSLLLAVGGAGRFTIDHRLTGRARADRTDSPAVPSAAGDPAKATEPASGSGSGSGSGVGSAPTGTGMETKPASTAKGTGGRTSPKAAASTANPAHTKPQPQPRPRLASEIVEDTSGTEPADKLVAGRKGRLRRKPSSTEAGSGSPGSEPDNDE